MQIKSVKINEEFTGALVDAIARAIEINDEYQPSYGVQVESEDGETLWDSESDDKMQNFVLTCESGAKCLVKARSAQEANARWDIDVDRGDAEPRRKGTTRLADAGDVQECIENEHDYRS